MKRLHVHISVDNLADSIGFYSALFATRPAVQKDDYAKWMLDDPRVNFAISQRGVAPGLNHLGIQVESGDELDVMQTRLAAMQTEVAQQEGIACCYAKSDKYWVTDPQGIAWETFHTLEQIPVFGDNEAAQAAKPACCVTPVTPARSADASCCAPRAAQEKCC